MSTVGTSSSEIGLWKKELPVFANSMFTGKKIETKAKAASRFAGKALGLPIIGVERMLSGEIFGKPAKEKGATKTRATRRRTTRKARRTRRTR